MLLKTVSSTQNPTAKRGLPSPVRYRPNGSVSKLQPELVCVFFTLNLFIASIISYMHVGVGVYLYERDRSIFQEMRSLL